MKINGERLKRVRIVRGLSMRALADQAGIHWNTVYRIERGETTGFLPATVAKLAAALQIDPESLIVWDDEAATDDRQGVPS